MAVPSLEVLEFGGFGKLEVWGQLGERQSEDLKVRGSILGSPFVVGMPSLCWLVGGRQLFRSVAVVMVPDVMVLCICTSASYYMIHCRRLLDQVPFFGFNCTPAQVQDT